MKRISIALLIVLYCLMSSQAQDAMNMYLVGEWDDDNLPLRAGGAYSDIWGYTAPDGSEYAILGSIDKIHFINVTDPANPQVVTEVTGGFSSIWRDFKTYSHYAYAVADEGSEGLRVYDLQNLPNFASQIFSSFAWFNRAHNIFVEESQGRLYVVGANTQNSGVLVFDIATNPASPTLLAGVNLPGGYVHDLYARGNTVYCSHGSAGLYIYDWTNASSPTLLGTLTSYPEEGYNHSSWLTDDGDYLVFCDETKDKGVKIMDVSDPTDLEVPSNQVFRSELLAPSFTNSIAHNPFIVGDHVYISYYHDGIQVFDISDPSDVTRIAYYDTYPENNNYNSYYGAWGVYPFFASGNIIASDILHGLQILRVGSAPLPAELGNWTGKAFADHILLEWETFSETNTAQFIIEKSLDGKIFVEIEQQPAAGFSTATRQYQARDPEPVAGTQYYRLQTLDLDGSKRYAPVISVDFTGQAPPQVEIFPTLAKRTDQIHIQFSSNTLSAPAQIRLFAANGTQVALQTTIDDTSISLADQPAGSYWLQVIIGKEVFQKHILLYD